MGGKGERGTDGLKGEHGEKGQMGLPGPRGISGKLFSILSNNNHSIIVVFNVI